jgi:hypothetical protein
LTAVLADHGLAVVIPASRTAEVRWHVAAILAALVGSEAFGQGKIPETDYERGLRAGFTMAREVYDPSSTA